MSGDGVSSPGVSATAPEESDLQLIYTGGDNFLARMKAMSDGRARAEKAYRELQMGTDAKAALADAKRQNDEAVATKQQADALLAKAKDEAARIVAEANSNTASALRDAKAKAAEIVVAAEKKKVAADTYVTQKRAEAKQMLDDAKAVNDAADASRAEINAAFGKAQSAEAGAKAAQLAAETKATELANKLSALEAVIAKIKA